MAPGEHLRDIGQPVVLGGQQNQVVVEQISRFVQKQIFVVIFGFDDQLDGFFSHLLGYFIDALLQESGSIGAFGIGALPVVDDFQMLCGVVTSDDVLDVIEEEATEDMQRMIGLSGEETLETPWNISLRNRLPWLYVNLATAILAGWVVSLFESTIDKYAVLAVFLPIIASQGGNAGIQTLTITVRSMALGGIEGRKKTRILTKELFVALLTGLATGVAVGLIGWWWRGDLVLGVIACLALLLNVICAAGAGVLIPIGLKALKIDPALASSIMLTTVTDVFGFLMFLGLAGMGFHYFPPN